MWGIHGVEGAYAAGLIDGEPIGSPDRAPSYPANYWEWWGGTRPFNNSAYIPLKPTMTGKKIEIYLLGMQGHRHVLKPDVWITAHPTPYEEQTLILEK